MEVNRIVARLQKEHGAELVRQRELSARLERDLAEAEATRRREAAAAEAAAKQLSSQANDLRARMAAMETSHREEMLRFLQERNRQSLRADGASGATAVTMGRRAVVPIVAGAGHKADAAGGTAATDNKLTHADPAAALPPLPLPEATAAASAPSTNTNANIDAFYAAAVARRDEEVGAAAEALKHHQLQKKSREALEERSRQLLSMERERDAARGDLADAKRYITSLVSQQQLLQTALSAAEASRTKLAISDPPMTNSHSNTTGSASASAADGGSIPAAFAASPLDIRAHKREVTRLEAVIDTLRREVCVVKELEVRAHVAEKDSLVMRVRELEAELARGGGGGGGASASSLCLKCGCASASYSAAPPSQDAVADLKSEQDARVVLRTKLDHIATLEATRLRLEGQLLDLRFERETLAMRVGRAERHVADILAVDAKHSSSVGNNANGGALSRNGGAISSRRGGGGTAPHSKEVRALESVIEGLRAVVERVQSENASLKASATSAAKHMEAVRELKGLRQRERELLEHLTVLSAKVSDHQRQLAAVASSQQQSSSSSGSPSSAAAAAEAQNTLLQRKLRSAQAAADQYHTELTELQARLGMPPSPTPAPRPSTAVGGAGSSGRQSPLSNGVSPNGVNVAAAAIPSAPHHHLPPPPLPPAPNAWHQQQMNFIADQERFLAATRAAASGQQSVSVARSLNLSPFAAENHHLDMHHRVAMQ